MENDNKRIAQNSLFLYIRSLLLLIVGLYVSRLILKNLGVIDYGIYNAVGGIVALFGFITSSMSNATSRYLVISIGRGDTNDICDTFANIKLIYFAFIAIVVVLGETIGLWFFYDYLIIPNNRLNAALWVYQFSIFASVVSIFTIPYNSAIIAHERMSAFAYISLGDGFLKLLIVYMLTVYSSDRLILYSFLVFASGVLTQFIYVFYCRKNFIEAKALPKLNLVQLKDMFSLSVWTLGGNIAWILNTHGINLLLNVFFGPVVNAARGIALQIQGAVSQFVINFQTALNPQLTKSYAQEDIARMHQLLVASSKYSFFLVLLLSLPIVFETPFILKIWLSIVPDNAIVFTRLILLYSMIVPLSNPLWTSILATGEIKKYQIWDNIIQFSVLPVSYILFKFIGAPAYVVFVTLIVFQIFAFVVRICIVLPKISLNLVLYIKKVIIPIVCVFLTSIVVPLFFQLYISSECFYRFLCTSAICIMMTIFSIWFIGLNNFEKKVIKNRLIKKKQ